MSQYCRTNRRGIRVIGRACCLAAGCAAVLLAGMAQGATAPAVRSSHDREFAYCATSFARVCKLYQYHIGFEGTLRPLKPAFVRLGREPRAPFAGPDGRSLYVPLVRTMLEYCIGGDGGLKPLDPPSVATGGVAAHAFSGNGRFLYVADDDRGFIYQYAVSSCGALQPLAPPRLRAGRSDSCQGVILSPDGRTLYSLNYGCTIGQFRVGSDGRLSPLPPAAVPPGGPRTTPDMVLGPGGHYAYANADTWDQATHTPGSLLTVFRVEKDGTLESVSSSSVEPMYWIWAHGDTLLAFLGDWQIAQYRMASAGQLVPRPVWSGPSNPSGFAVTPSGRYAYQVGGDDGQIYRYRCEPDGSLTPLSGVTRAPGVGETAGVYVDPSGRFLYTGTQSLRWGSAIGQFRIGGDGQLTPLNPPSVAMPFSGNLVIVRLPARATKPAPKTKGKAGAKHKQAVKTKGKAPVRKGVKGKY